MFKLLKSALKRLTTAVTSPFRMIIVRIQRMFNFNVITAKLITPLTRQVKSLITLRPQSRDDYYVIGRWWVYKKLFMTLVLVICAGILIYFTMFAPKLPSAPSQARAVATDVTFDYDDMKLRAFSGIANIRASDGKVVYTGEIASGVAKGNGTLWGRDGKLLYEGGFDQNKYSGEGISYYPSGRKKYEGSFAANLYQGEGNLYAPDGTLLYTGQFANGLYSGKGKSYSEDGVLLYEGSFAEGKYHGEGIRYYADGLIRYQGAFFQGLEQGQGTLYSPTGKMLYHGDMLAGEINYRSLVHSTLADIEASFSETPRIFYTDTDSAFVYEQAGVIVTASCRVLVDVWTKPDEEVQDGSLYYLPGEGAADFSASARSGGEFVFPSTAPKEDDGITGRTPQVYQLDDGTEVIQFVVAPDGMTGLSPLLARPEGTILSAPSLPGGELSLQRTAWYVANDAGEILSYDEEETAPASSESSQSSAASSGGWSQSAQAGETTPGGQQSPDITVNLPDGDSTPPFIEKKMTLYFEIDTNIWQSETDLDKSKVPVQRITVFGSPQRQPPEGAVEFEDSQPPTMEDCVAIDFIRQKIPTTLPQVIFELDNQNRLFVRMKNINFAASFPRRNYQSDALTYRYCYAERTSETPLFFSIER
ncbi:hypothetical protein CE91St46_16680 [Eubacteriales bacterium]|nr:hypothetical protein [Faecalicatena sp. BF-R-105]GKH50557.1 hypothetical protein CE91St46_16680 [Eubacteriales bacterium]GKH63279.1 hypothetical protein CE91St47_17480 [Eubacteriales bacterium]